MSEAVSRSELEQYDRNELIELVQSLQTDLQAVESRQEAFSVQLKEIKKLLIGQEGEMAELDMDDMNGLAWKLRGIEQTHSRILSRLEDNDGKGSKVAEIVRFAANARSEGQPAIKLTAKDIKGATGCSRRYAYDLMDDLPTEYDWFLTPQEMKQYGSLEIDNSGERRLGVDFEGVHSSGVPLNKFTTRNGREGEE